MKKSVCYVDVHIIDYLGAQDIFQRNVVAMIMIVNFKKHYFLLDPDLSWKFKQHLHSF